MIFWKRVYSCGGKTKNSATTRHLLVDGDRVLAEIHKSCGVDELIYGHGRFVVSAVNLETGSVYPLGFFGSIRKAKSRAMSHVMGQLMESL